MEPTVQILDYSGKEEGGSFSFLNKRTKDCIKMFISINVNIYKMCINNIYDIT